MFGRAAKFLELEDSALRAEREGRWDDAVKLWRHAGALAASVNHRQRCEDFAVAAEFQVHQQRINATAGC